jgi:HSP20 family protein
MLTNNMIFTNWAPFRGAKCMNPFYRNYVKRDENSDYKKYDVSDSADENNAETSDRWNASWYPSTDIYDTADDFVLKMDLPGVPKEEVSIEFQENVLTVKGERKNEVTEEKDCFCNMERVSGKFYRSFRFPENVDGSKITAIMKDGILELRIAKPAEQKPVNIPITIN